MMTGIYFENATFVRGFQNLILIDRPESSYRSQNLVHVRSIHDVGWHFFVILSDAAAERQAR